MLFRYRKLNDYTISALEKDELWISSSDTFNDFFDVQIGYNLEKIKSEFFHKIGIKQSYKEYKAKYPYSRKNEDEYFSSYIDYVCQCFIINIKRKVLVCSLTPHEDNAVMWSHYADDSKGFVVGYNENDIEKITGGPIHLTCLKVIYSNDPFDATKYIIDSINVGIKNGTFDMEKAYFNFEDLMFHGKCEKQFYIRKTKEWEYEDEYRIMHYYGSSIGNKHQIIGRIKPSKLILGQKMNIVDKLNLFRLCTEKGIPLFKSEISWNINTYGIKVSPFTNDDLQDIMVIINDEMKKGNKNTGE